LKIFLNFGEAELEKFLDSNDNNPNFGMALQEAIDQLLMTEEEAKRILDSAAADLQWGRMLADAGRNEKLQEFIKSNRWMRRQKFFDFVAMEEIEFEQKKRLKALERKERELQDEVQHSILIFAFCLSILSRIRSLRITKRKRDILSGGSRPPNR
jgi:hypothetical protein